MDHSHLIKMLEEGNITWPFAEVLAAKKDLPQSELDRIISVMLDHPVYEVRYIALDILLCRIALKTSNLEGHLEKAILDVFYLYPENSERESARIIEKMKEAVVSFYLDHGPSDPETLSRIFGFIESMPKDQQADKLMGLAKWGSGHTAPETQNYLEKLLKSNDAMLIKNALRVINVMPGLLKNDWFLKFASFLNSEIPEARYYSSEILKQKSNLPENVQQDLFAYLNSSTVTSDIDSVIGFMKL